MSDSQNPWSREGAESWSAQQRSTQGAQPQSAASGPQAGPPYSPASSPAGQQAGPSAQGPYPAPSATATVEQPRKRRAGRITAGILGLALLAGGVGAGSAVVTTNYLSQQDEQAAITSTQDESGNDSATQTQGTTIQQADPNSPNWTTVAESASQSVVAIKVATGSGGGQGSGVIIDQEGHIVTNNHVVAGAQRIEVVLGDTTYEAEVVGTDASTDLAVLKFIDPPSDLQPMAWGDSNALSVGDPVMAIGNPLGLSNTVTTGIVSALDRPVLTEETGSQSGGDTPGDAVITAAIQTNAAINPGNSGGALVDGSGHLVGITSSIASLSQSQSGAAQSGNIGIGFAIPSDQAQNVVKQLIETGSAVYPQIGVTAADTTSTGRLGAVVQRVVPDSPAAAAGLQAGDVITAVNDRQVSSTEQLIGIIRAQAVGDTVKVTYEREGQENTTQATLTASGS